MTIYQPLSEQQKQLVSEFLDSDQVSEGCLDFVAMHGFLTGIATGPESLMESDWLAFLFNDRPDYHSKAQQTEIEAIIKQQAMVIQRAIYLGDELELPCPLTAASLGKTNQLSDWCFGFVEAIGIDEDSWFADPESVDAVAELILPAGILSDQFVDPELEHLSTDAETRQQMADNLIENIQDLYLLFRE